MLSEAQKRVGVTRQLRCYVPLLAVAFLSCAANGVWDDANLFCGMNWWQAVFTIFLGNREGPGIPQEGSRRGSGAQSSGRGIVRGAGRKELGLKPTLPKMVARVVVDAKDFDVLAGTA